MHCIQWSDCLRYVAALLSMECRMHRSVMRCRTWWNVRSKPIAVLDPKLFCFVLARRIYPFMHAWCKLHHVGISFQFCFVLSDMLGQIRALSPFTKHVPPTSENKRQRTSNKISQRIFHSGLKLNSWKWSHLLRLFFLSLFLPFSWLTIT